MNDCDVRIAELRKRAEETTGIQAFIDGEDAG